MGSRCSAVCLANSVPLSNVMVLRKAGGSGANKRMRCRATRLAALSGGRVARMMQRGVPGELSAVVERDGLAQSRRQRREQTHEMPGDALGRFVGRPGRGEDAGLSLVDGEYRLTVFGEQDEVGFPMAG